MNIETHLIVESTQTIAAQHIKNGRREIDAVRADYQSKGRGRWGRVWEAESGVNLTITYLLWNIPIPKRVWELGLIMAAAVCEGIDLYVIPRMNSGSDIKRSLINQTDKALLQPDLSGFVFQQTPNSFGGTLKKSAPLLRWPNDVMLNGKKLAGILVETTLDPEGNQVAMIGVGVNVNQKQFPEELQSIATSLLIETSQEFSVEGLANSIWERFHALYPELILHPSKLAQIWRERDATTGKRFRAPDGRSGEALGINEAGLIIIQWEDGTVDELPVAEPIF